jgi:hypothetical protein
LGAKSSKPKTAASRSTPPLKSPEAAGENELPMPVKSASASDPGPDHLILKRRDIYAVAAALERRDAAEASRELRALTDCLGRLELRRMQDAAPAVSRVKQIAIAARSQSSCRRRRR